MLLKCWFSNLPIYKMVMDVLSNLKKFQIPRRSISRQATSAIMALLWRNGASLKSRTNCIHTSLRRILTTCNPRRFGFRPRPSFRDSIYQSSVSKNLKHFLK